MSKLLTYMLEAVVADNVLVKMQFHTNHSTRTLVAVLSVTRAMCVWNCQTIHSHSFLFGSIHYAVFLNLAKQLDTKQAKERHEE